MDESVPSFDDSLLPNEPGSWERECVGEGRHVWSRELEDGELDFDPFDHSVSEDLHVVQVEVVWMSGEWNTTLAKPSPHRGLLDVVPEKCDTFLDVEEALAYAQELLDEESRTDKHL